ncbi:uncharacterized protein LOC9637867 isoform X1 [Selaginella moellendorffii]|uniref:uncharacterized protein LOC9637867 isoform X1 n=1 Tax=Selaginella moellendorffii TaxID=88036 RepID=UPI000D1C45B8|nr:uncharacterized protein LOC9637867 isoform X1 [Selaginella moellendorffii]|eukprot:XP_002975185.2 uncharacterized protein LOC9637867 isoform X1 [Selaginella moellendorffii]
MTRPFPAIRCSIRPATLLRAQISADSTSRISSDETSTAQLLLGGAKATSIASAVWKRIVRPGDTVVDTTCGNGIDTLLLARLVSPGSLLGRVYGFDIQKEALERTSLLLEQHLTPEQRNRVELFQDCHSKMGEVLKDVRARLVVYNLGYLPHGDKELITRAPTTIQSLHCSLDLLQPGGLVSVICYVGHPGGQEEYEAVKEFASLLPPSEWICTHLEQLHRPLAPHLILLAKKVTQSTLEKVENDCSSFS